MALQNASQPMPQATTYDIIEDVEDPSKYHPGGFHPISIGDTMKEGRYRTVHKLGFGGYSTTWLALDTWQSQYVAIKICSANGRESLEKFCGGWRMGRRTVPPTQGST